MPENEIGTQPLDALMTSLGLSNHDLVAASTEQLSHKMVQKGRKGRRLTPKIKTKILNALLIAVPDRAFAHRDLFNY
jgi:glycerol-3-phosphate dehydrogenase